MCNVLSSLVPACILQVDYTRMGFEGMWPSLLSMARYGTNTQVRQWLIYCRRDVNTQVRLRRIYCRHDVNTQVRLQRIYGLCNNVLSMRRVYCRHYISTNTWSSKSCMCTDWSLFPSCSGHARSQLNSVQLRRLRPLSWSQWHAKVLFSISHIQYLFV